MARLTPEIMDPYQSEPDDERFPGFDFTNVHKLDFEPVSTTEFKITKSMIDCNNHVHNTSYMDLAREALPEGLDSASFNDIEIAYRKEIAPGATVSLEYSSDGGRHLIMIKDAADGTLHAAILLGEQA